MKKTLLTLALCAASLVGTAFAEGFTLGHDDFGNIYVTGSGSYSDLLQELENFGEEYYPSPFTYIVCGMTPTGESAELSLTFDEPLQNKVTPAVGMLEYVNATFTFNDLMTLRPQYQEYGEWKYIGPSMQTGWIDELANPHPGTLNVAISEEVIKTWLSGEDDLSTRVSYPLLYDVAEIGTMTEQDVLKLILLDEQGKEEPNFEFNGKYYSNAGIVLNAGDLQKNQIALLYERGAGSGEWGGGALSLVVLGENYIPVPEPATGTLSLLALAGLAARRRRK